MEDHSEGVAPGRTPLVSIVIPVYNRAHSILPALNSVRDQTFRDFECLVVDDGSKDVELLASVVEGFDERFRLLRKSNAGAGAARNHGIDNSRGRYVALLDSDDQFMPEKLEHQLGMVRAIGDTWFLCYSKLLVDRGIGKFWVKPPRGLRKDERVDEYLMADDGWIQTSSMLMSAELARAVRFDERLPSSQDTDFAIRCANAGARVLMADAALVVMNDVYDPKRVSKQRNHLPLLAWIESMRSAGAISERSYWAYRGWQCARVASYSSVLSALRIYAGSAIRGVYPPKVAATIFAQIILPQVFYQRVATFVVKLRGARGR